MAAGDVHIFAQYVYSTTITGLPVLWASDTIKGAICTNTTVPAVTSSDPGYSASRTTDFSATEVTPGGSYSAGGISLTSPTVSLSTVYTNLNVTSPISLAANASNPTGAYWMIFYSSTASGKQAVGYLDLGGPLSLVAGLQINVNGSSSGTQILFQGTAA